MPMYSRHQDPVCGCELVATTDVRDHGRPKERVATCGLVVDQCMQVGDNVSSMIDDSSGLHVRALVGQKPAPLAALFRIMQSELRFNPHSGFWVLAHSRTHRL